MNLIAPQIANEEMLQVLMDDQTPFIVRLNTEKTGYEVIQLTNDDWREVTLDGHQQHHGTWQFYAQAKQACKRLEAQWRYQRLRQAMVP